MPVLKKKTNSNPTIKSSASNIKQKKKFAPSIFAILLSLIFFVVIISWIIYWVQGSNPEGSVHPAGLIEIFSAPIQGFINSADVLVFLLCLSAFLFLVNQTKALDAGIGRLFIKLKGKETLLIITLMIVFAICGTTFSMCEATIPFYFMLLPILYAAGFDSFLALIVICFGAGVGVLASTINPVLLANAVDAANSGIVDPSMHVELMDGVIWRLISLIVVLSFAIGYAIWYSKRIKKDITKSYVYSSIAEHSKKFHFDIDAIPQLTKQRKTVLGIFITTFIVLIIFAVPWDVVTNTSLFDMIGSQLAEWFPYIAGQSIDPITGKVISNVASVGTWAIFEMAFLFFIASVAVYATKWNSEKELGDNFIKGASEFVGVIFIVAIASGFSVILNETGIANLLINAISGMATSMSSYLFILVLLFLFSIIAFLIPSVSGFAKAVFPVVGPALATANFSISGSILTFSFASGIINLIAPTAVAFVIGTQICGISFGTFYKKAWPLYIGIIVLCCGLLLLGTVMNSISPGIF